MRHLRDEKLLICNKPNELKMRRKEPQVGSRIPVYRIDAAFFEEEIDHQSHHPRWFALRWDGPGSGPGFTPPVRGSVRGKYCGISMRSGVPGCFIERIQGAEGAGSRPA